MKGFQRDPQEARSEDDPQSPISQSNKSKQGKHASLSLKLSTKIVEDEEQPEPWIDHKLNRFLNAYRPLEAEQNKQNRMQDQSQGDTSSHGIYKSLRTGPGSNPKRNRGRNNGTVQRS